MWTDPVWELVFRVATWIAAIAGGLSITAAFVSAWVGYEITGATQKDANQRIREANDRTLFLETELTKARAETAIADANLLAEQRLTARERWRLERIERAVLPRSQFVNWSELAVALRKGRFQPINLAISGGAEAKDFGFALMRALIEAGMLGRVIDAPTDPRVLSMLPNTSAGLSVLTANEEGQRLSEMLWQRFQIGGGASAIAMIPKEWTNLPRDANCLLVQENGWAMAPPSGQPGEGLDKHDRPVPNPR